MNPQTAPAPTLAHASSWSLQRRLVVSLILCIGATFMLLFPMLDLWIDREIFRRMDTALMQRAVAVGRVLDRLDLGRLERLMPEYEPGGHTEFFTVFDRESGQTILRSPNSAGASLPLGPVDRGTPRYYDIKLPDGHAGRALATPVSVKEGRHGLLVIATEREDWDRTERRIHVVLLSGVMLATLLATGLALLLARRVIRMLHRASAPLAGIHADHPIEPIAPIGSDFPRELRPFADAFNLGLRHLYAAIERERRFSRDVAHELRTPLAEIRASAESALNDPDPAQARAGLNAAITASARMQRSVDALLLLARLESGQHTSAPDPLDLAALMRELLAEFDGQPPLLRALPIRASLPPSAWVRSDQGVVERIVSNLLRNAVEYAPEGDEIECRLERGKHGDSHGDPGWMLSISNAAPELESADLERFGLRFWRKQSEGATAHHAGLGLALTFALAQAIELPLRFSLDQGRLTARLGPWAALV